LTEEQAVSKWETGTSLPDITLLPKLASFFGVRIDELFSVDHEDELGRIDALLQKESMTDQNYAYAKRILDGILRENPEDVEAMKRYAKVYLSKTNTEFLTAGQMLEKAMELNPLDEEVYSLYRSVRGGSEYKQHSDNDWFIRVCEPYARKYPQNINLYRMLIEAMISKKYFDRAEELLAAVRFKGEYKSMKEVFLGSLDIRRQGSAALDLCSAASGRAGLYFELNASLWDFAAGVLITREAGGICLNCEGEEIPLDGSKSSVAAGSPKAVEDFLKIAGKV